MTDPPENQAWMSELNAQQRRAVTHIDGPLLVVAGAGSGKTRTLAYRVAYLMANGVDPGRILLLTFTRRAAEEMLRRAAGVFQKGGNVTARVWGGTFHSTANRLLRIYAGSAGISPDYVVMDEADAADMLNMIRHEMGLASGKKRFPRKRTCRSIYSRCMNGVEDLTDVLDRHFPWCSMWEEELQQIFRRYVERKLERSVLDYDDLLIYWEQLLQNDSIAEDMGGRFDHILVDEYQDTNVVQARILQGMRRCNPNLMVVGDDAQSIYSFRAATVRNMLDFPEIFPGTTVVTLEQNYRSVQPILVTTNLLISQASNRFSKDLWSSRESHQSPKLVTCRDEFQQDDFVVERVLEHYEEGIPLKRQAVLFRASQLSDSLEMELTRRSIPYHKYGGLRFLESSHIKDLVSLLRVLENPRDRIAWFRVLQMLDGVGPKTAERAIRHVEENKNDCRALRTFSAPAPARKGVENLAEVMEDLAEAGSKNPAMQLERINRFYGPLLEKNYDNPVMRRRDVENLEQIASGYRSRRRFLTDLTLDPPRSTSDLAGPPAKDEDWLNLSTIHSAKGCEWDVVFLIHAADGCLPSDMATGKAEEVEEERRLTYVAMTRAKDFLYVTWPLRYYHKWYRYTDKHSYAQLCRFFSDEVLETMERVNLAQQVNEDRGVSTSAKVDVASRIRAIWS